MYVPCVRVKHFFVGRVEFFRLPAFNEDFRVAHMLRVVLKYALPHELIVPLPHDQERPLSIVPLPRTPRYLNPKGEPPKWLTRPKFLSAPSRWIPVKIWKTESYEETTTVGHPSPAKLEVGGSLEDRPTVESGGGPPLAPLAVPTALLSDLHAKRHRALATMRKYSQLKWQRLVTQYFCAWMNCSQCYVSVTDSRCYC